MGYTSLDLVSLHRHSSPELGEISHVIQYFFYFVPGNYVCALRLYLRHVCGLLYTPKSDVTKQSLLQVVIQRSRATTFPPHPHLHIAGICLVLRCSPIHLHLRLHLGVEIGDLAEFIACEAQTLASAIANIPNTNTSASPASFPAP